MPFDLPLSSLPNAIDQQQLSLVAVPTPDGAPIGQQAAPAILPNGSLAPRFPLPGYEQWATLPAQSTHGSIGAGGIVTSPQQIAQPGDWHCPACGDLQFARNPTCRKCGAAKPFAIEDEQNRRHQHPGNWDCPACGDLQFARNRACRKCNTPKPKTGLEPKKWLFPESRRDNMVYVRNLVPCDWQQLKEHMSQAGDVKQVKILTQPACVAHVRYAVKAEADFAKAQLNGSIFLGQIISVEEYNVKPSVAETFLPMVEASYAQEGAMCSMHNRFRNIRCLVADDWGGHQCFPGAECDFLLNNSGKAVQCSLHGQKRIYGYMMDDGVGGYCCMVGERTECKIKSAADIAVCSIHGSNRAKMYMVDNGQGGLCCKPSDPCKVGGGGQKRWNSGQQQPAALTNDGGQSQPLQDMPSQWGTVQQQPAALTDQAWHEMQQPQSWGPAQQQPAAPQWDSRSSPY